MSIDKLLENHISKIPDKDIAVLLSGGIDSSSIAISAKRVGKNVHAYTFTLETFESYDYLKSKELCEYFGWDFVGIKIPTNEIKEKFKLMFEKYECSKKTHIECLFPMLYVIPEIKERYIFSGIGSDSYCGLSKNDAIISRNNKKEFDKLRNKKYEMDDNISCIKQIKNLCKENEKQFILPFKNKDILDYYLNFSWEEINKPKQKYLIRKCYPELEEMKIKNHWNYQLCAGIDKLFETLLNDNEINFKNRKRMLDVYRDWSKNDRILIC